jgi:hypothetical protein
MKQRLCRPGDSKLEAGCRQSGVGSYGRQLSVLVKEDSRHDAVRLGVESLRKRKVPLAQSNFPFHLA